MQCDLSTVSIVKLLCLKMNKNNMYIRNYVADCVIKCVLQGNIMNLSIIYQSVYLIYSWSNDLYKPLLLWSFWTCYKVRLHSSWDNGTIGDTNCSKQISLSRMFKLAELIRCPWEREANLKGQIFKTLFSLMKRVKCLEAGYCTCAALQIVNGTWNVHLEEGNNLASWVCQSVIIKYTM